MHLYLGHEKARHLRLGDLCLSRIGKEGSRLFLVDLIGVNPSVSLSAIIKFALTIPSVILRLNISSCSRACHSFLPAEIDVRAVLCLAKARKWSVVNEDGVVV